MFRNLRLQIFIYYFLTVSTFLGILHYFLSVVEVQNIFILASVILLFVSISGFMISKLAIDPLQEHVQNLQNLSKETLHELNLPISTIKTNIHMLKKNIDDDKTIKRLKRVETACDMLKQRYNELDYMIKMQSSPSIEDNFNLDELVMQRIDFLNSIYPHINFNLNLESTNIINDKTGLSKVIDNLIDNGVKYSKDSTEIEISLKNYELQIKDYGCGMDEVELIQIFDNYYQSDGSIKGFGIGLSMVNRFCNSHNIKLNINSAPNVGTTVSLKFKEN